MAIVKSMKAVKTNKGGINPVKKVALKRDADMAARVKKVAAICEVSKDYVYKVLDGRRSSERVMAVYMELYEGDNKLLKAVKEAVPFDLAKVLVVEYQADGYQP